MTNEDIPLSFGLREALWSACALHCLWFLEAFKDEKSIKNPWRCRAHALQGRKPQKIAYWICIAIFHADALLGEVSSLEQKTLKTYYTAQVVSPSTSIQDYALLKQEAPKAWQKAILTLNLSSLLLKEGEWQKAAPLLESLEWQEPAPQDFLWALWQNRARLHWLEALTQLQSPYRSDQEDGLTLLLLTKHELAFCRQISPEWREQLQQQIEEANIALLQPAKALKKRPFQQFLLNLIDQEQKALRLILGKQVGQPLAMAPQVLQQQALAQADFFFPTLLKEQQTLYSKKRLCQCRPWDRVIPLFEQGLTQAKLAQEVLTNRPLYLGAAIGAIRKALIAWRGALQLLDERQDPMPPEASLSDSSRVQQIWRSLQQASSSEIPSKPQGAPPQIKGDRPW